MSLVGWSLFGFSWFLMVKQQVNADMIDMIDMFRYVMIDMFRNPTYSGRTTTSCWAFHI